MSTQLPKVRRVGGTDQRLVQILIAVVGILIVAVAVILFGGPLFDDSPKTADERDIRLLINGLKSHPNDATVLMTLAETEYRLGKKADAMEHAAKAAKAGAKMVGIPRRYAQLLLQQDKLDDARKWAQTEIGLDKAGTNIEARFLLAQILFKKGERKEALAMMKKALDADYMSADMRIVYAKMLAEAGKKKEAVAEYKEAMRFLPNDQRIVDGLAQLGVKVDKTEKVSDPHGGKVPAGNTGQ